MIFNEETKNAILREIELLAKNNYGSWKTEEEAKERVLQATEEVFENLKTSFDEELKNDLNAIAKEMTED